MSETSNLKIPFIQAAQNQKEVTANTALEALDASANAAIAVAMGDALKRQPPKHVVGDIAD